MHLSVVLLRIHLYAHQTVLAVYPSNDRRKIISKIEAAVEKGRLRFFVSRRKRGRFQFDQTLSDFVRRAHFRANQVGAILSWRILAFRLDSRGTKLTSPLIPVMPRKEKSDLWIAPQYSLKGPNGERAWENRPGGAPSSKPIS